MTVAVLSFAHAVLSIRHVQALEVAAPLAFLGFILVLAVQMLRAPGNRIR